MNLDISSCDFSSHEMLNDFFLEFRKYFPDMTLQADLAYIKRWNETVEAEFIFSWFECVSDVLNNDMMQGISVDNHFNLFEYFSGKYELGTADERACIDTAIVENLFWEVQPDKSASYWSLFPSNLQALYIDFFEKTPMEYFVKGF